MPASRAHRKSVRMSKVLGELVLEELPPAADASRRARFQPRAGTVRRSVEEEALPAGAIGSAYIGAGYTGYRMEVTTLVVCSDCGRETTGRTVYARRPFR